MFAIAEYSDKIQNLQHRVFESMRESDIPYSMKEKDSNKIRVVFAGQYSAGKSSIMKMLTGREDIQIGAGITTQKADVYEWNGIEIVDTPGIDTELRPDHDEISYAAIAEADMLVYVVTNELFDSHIAENFRQLAIDRNKAGEMILVVNKMGRTSEGNTEKQQEIIREDLRKVLDPFTPEQLHLCFLDAESYIESLEERTDDPEYADELLEQSGYDEFVKTLDFFVKEKSLAGKLTTILYILEDQLQKAVKILAPVSANAELNALEENYYQQRHEMASVRNSLQKEIRDIFTTAAAEIRNIGADSANLIIEGCKQAEVEDTLEQNVRKAQRIMENCQSEALHVLESRLREMQGALDKIESSEFSSSLKDMLIEKYDSLPDSVKKILGTTGTGFQKAGQAVMRSAYNAEASGGLKLANFSGSKVHDIVLEAGHSLGYKFKPWEAIKITKKIAIGAQVLNVLGVGVSVFMQIKADQDEENTRNSLKSTRQNIRSQFNQAASGLEEQGNKFIRSNVTDPLEKAIQGIDSNICEIRNTRANHTLACKNMEKLAGECRLLIQDIHNNL